MQAGKCQLFMWSSTFADMVILGLCWILCSIPIITIGAATSALYYSVAKTMRYGTGKPVREFFKAFRENQRAGIMIFLPSAITFITTLILAFLAQAITCLLYTSNTDLIIASENQMMYFQWMQIIIIVTIIGLLVVLSYLDVYKRQEDNRSGRAYRKQS